MSDDTISRREALDVLNKLARDNFTLRDAFSFYLGALHDAADGIKALSAQPERKTGKWHLTDAYPHWLCCDQCHKKMLPNAEWVELYNIPTNFCPNCGVEMEGSAV